LGTLAPHQIVGLTTAVQLGLAEMAVEGDRLGRLRESPLGYAAGQYTCAAQWPSPALPARQPEYQHYGGGWDCPGARVKVPGGPFLRGRL
jgi:hypothetical protein